MGLFDRLKKGLSRSSHALGENLTQLFGQAKLDEAVLQELEEQLITADLGLDAAAHIIAQLKAHKFTERPTAEAIKAQLAKEITQCLLPVQQDFTLPSDKKPAVILMTGVNGAGKTTTLGKLAQKFKAQGKRVLVVAGDTFRAAAIEQLDIWSKRAGVEIATTKPGGDAAGLVYGAYERAVRDGVDILLIDTAGRLQSNENLMAELQKIIRVVRKLDISAPHASLLILDATVGQNALSQAQGFLQAAEINGLIMTKLDGTARGGVLVALARKLALPIYFIGVGEQLDDLQAFHAHAFAHALIGLDI